MGKRGRGRDRERTKGSRRERGRERLFHVSPEFERPPFHVSIVIFSLFSFHLLHLSPRDKDITLLVQGGQYRRVRERVHSLQREVQQSHINTSTKCICRCSLHAGNCLKEQIYCVGNMMPPAICFLSKYLGNLYWCLQNVHCQRQKCSFWVSGKTFTTYFICFPWNISSCQLQHD